MLEKEYAKAEGEHVWNAFKQMKSYMEKSYLLIDKSENNNYFTTTNGKHVYDGVSTLLNSNLGHHHTKIQKAITEQLQYLDTATMFTSTNTAALDYAKQLLEATQDRYYSVFFTNSGSEACDTAIKIARKYWKNLEKNRPGIISLQGCYHGSSIGAMMVSHGGYTMDDYTLKHEHFYQIPVPDLMLHHDFKDEDELVQFCLKEAEQLMKNSEVHIGAFIMEQVQLSNAAFPLPQKFVQGIAELCKVHDILLIIDEVATGFGRTGTLFVSEQFQTWGDIMMFAKGVTSGYIPMGGVLVTKKVFKNFWSDEPEMALEHGFTTGGHPVACAAASACLQTIYQESLCNNVIRASAYLTKKLNQFKKYNFVKEIRGCGLMIAMILDESVRMPGMEKWGLANIISRFLVNKGLLLYPDDENVLIIAPPLNVTLQECDVICSILDKCFTKVDFIIKNMK